MSMTEPQMPTILCCMCATPIEANAANMCAPCLRNQVDITEGITKEITIHQCRGCLRWHRPPWVAAELESRELLALCLKKIPNLKGVKLVDANWIWTEPHSKRLQLKLTVQKEVMTQMILQQSFVVTFIVRNEQCEDCQASFANQAWRAVVQVRQRVDHKRTFYFLEQLILKHKAHEKTTSIESHPDGIDFFFSERSHAIRFVDFLRECVPIKVKTAKKLVSADNHSNTHNYKFTYAAEIAPICKDDLVALPLKLARNLGNISTLCLVQSVGSTIRVLDPTNTQIADIDSDKYWRYPFTALRSMKQLQSFTVLDSNPMSIPIGGGRPVRTNRKTRLGEMDVVRDKDFGVNDTRFSTISHLGMLLKSGDSALGYDLTSAVVNEADLEPLRQEGRDMPDVVLVKKHYPDRMRKRNWKLKQMEGVEEYEGNGKRDLNKDEMDYENFLDEVEEDQEMRAQINVYKDDKANAMEDETSIPLHELLDDLKVEEQAAVLNPAEAEQMPAWELEEL